MRKFIAAASVVIAGVMLGAGVVSAHHPVIQTSTDCHDDGTWSATFTVQPDANRPSLTWRIVSPDGYAPSGSQQASGSSTFTRTVTAGVDVPSITETVTAKWSNGVTATRKATAYLPQGCTTPTTTTTTTTTTTVPETTTTIPATTTTEPATTTTAAETTTTAAPTTSVVATVTSQPYRSTTSTTTINPVDVTLPPTGNNGGITIAAASILMLGAALTITAARR